MKSSEKDSESEVKKILNYFNGSNLIDSLMIGIGGKSFL
jgi:hypothetical protein